jgi:branched-chain amino acid transport system ATP-binding protein
LFDEPSLGLAPNFVEQTFRFILDIRAKGAIILMVEQNALAALQLCDWSYLLIIRKVVQKGASAEMLANPYIRQAQLGG